MSTLATPNLPLNHSLGRPKSASARKFQEALIIGFLILCGLFTLLTTLAIIVILAKETFDFFHLPDVTVTEFLFGLEWNPLLGSTKHFGVWPLVCGTVLVTVVAMGLALPLGLITAIWLSEYAHPKVRAVIKPLLEIIAGIPTVVFGFFALMVITPSLQWLHGGFNVYNAASAGLAVGIMCLPIVSSLSEDALQAVPRSLREGAYALGSTPFEVSTRVVTPAALSGIIAAFLLAIARAIGETMIVALAAGSTPVLTGDPRDSVQTMTGYMVQIFLGDASNFGPEYLSSYAVAASLFAMTLVLTVIGHKVRIRFRQVYE